MATGQSGSPVFRSIQGSSTITSHQLGRRKPILQLRILDAQELDGAISIIPLYIAQLPVREYSRHARCVNRPKGCYLIASNEVSKYIYIYISIHLVALIRIKTMPINEDPQFQPACNGVGPLIRDGSLKAGLAYSVDYPAMSRLGGAKTRGRVVQPGCGERGTSPAPLLPTYICIS